jgi:hypothetical protein
MSRIQSSGTGGNNGGGGSGNVTGVPPTNVNDIAVWGDTTGTTIKDSLAIVQTGGAVQSQGFVFDRQIINDITVPDHYTIINSDLELISGDIYLDGDSQLILL